jgi:hypothetical protein
LLHGEQTWCQYFEKQYMSLDAQNGFLPAVWCCGFQSTFRGGCGPSQQVPEESHVESTQISRSCNHWSEHVGISIGLISSKFPLCPYHPCLYIYIYMVSPPPRPTLGIFVYIYISVCVCTCTIYLFVYLFVCLSVCLSIYRSIYLPIDISTDRSISPSIYLSIHPFYLFSHDIPLNLHDVSVKSPLYFQHITVFICFFTVTIILL